MDKLLRTIIVIFATVVDVCNAQNTIVTMQPENGAVEVNIDTHLMLTMSEETEPGEKGVVSVYDKGTGRLVDRLDMSIPAGPTTGQPSRLTSVAWSSMKTISAHSPVSSATYLNSRPIAPAP